MSSFRALYLIVHNQSSQPLNVINDGILLSPGFYHTVGIDRTFNKKLSKPYSNCIDELRTENPYAKKLFGFFKDLNMSRYDQNFCYSLCRQDKIRSIIVTVRILTHLQYEMHPTA